MGQQPQSGGGLVSVILPTFNRARTLARAIRSVLNQGYENLELLVVDDASTDETEALMATLVDPRLRYIRLARNGGASRARNEGLRLAKGDYIAFQDSDDEWLADKLERQVAAAREVGSPADPVCVFHTKVMYVSGGTHNNAQHKISCIPVLDKDSTREDFIREIHIGNLISTQALLISRGAFEKIGLFDERLANCVDWDYAISLMHETKVVFIDEPLVMTYLQTDSISILNRRGARSQLRIGLKLLRGTEADPAAVAILFSRVGWWVSKLNHPRLGRRLLRKSIALSPGDWKTWARLAVAEALVLGSLFKPARNRPPQRTPMVAIAG